MVCFGVFSKANKPIPDAFKLPPEISSFVKLDPFVAPRCMYASGLMG